MCEQGNAQIKKSETLFHPLLHFWSTTIIWSQQTSHKITRSHRSQDEWPNLLVLTHTWRHLYIPVTIYFFPFRLLASDLLHLVTHQHQRICSHSSDSHGHLLSAVGDLLCAVRSPYFTSLSHFPRNSSCSWKFFSLWLAKTICWSSALRALN